MGKNSIERKSSTKRKSCIKPSFFFSICALALGQQLGGQQLGGQQLGALPGLTGPSQHPASHIECPASHARRLTPHIQRTQHIQRPASAASVGRPPNELGLIPILMYHAVGGEPEFAGGPRYDKHGLNIAPKTLRRQLQQMYEAGWYPVNMRDLLTARLPVPRGKTPVVLTFDDARPTQFRYLRNGRIDPNCVVGILEAFHQAHPGWPQRATFYVLPESTYNGVPFDQDGLETRKLRFLVRRGYELGNHTTSHRSLAGMSRRMLRWEMATSVRYFRRQVPQAALTTMALPYGIAPRSKALWRYLLGGTQGGMPVPERVHSAGAGRPIVCVRGQAV